MAYIMAHWTSIVAAVLAILEIVSLFIPKASGTLAGIIKVLAGLPSVKDPKIGQ